MNQIRHVIRLLQNNLFLPLERNVLIVRMRRLTGLTVRVPLKINSSLYHTYSSAWTSSSTCYT